MLRCLACMMVVLMHTPQPNSAGGYVLSSISLLAAPSIGLFFMVSGALLLPVTKPTKEFLKHRLAKIAVPVLFWSLLYLLVRYFKTNNSEELFKSIISIPFSAQGCAVFWFVYVMIGLYVLAPIISTWLQKASKREIEFYLLLWLVTMCYPILNLFVCVDDGKSGILYYFTGYVGYFLLGYYLHNYVKQWSMWILAILFVFPIGCAVACKLLELKIDFYDIFWYLSILVVAMCVSLFMGIKVLFGDIKLNTKFKKFIINFSQYSFGIYLIHFFIIRDILWQFNLTLLSNGGGILETFVITLIISYLIVHLISRLPKSESFIGLKRK